MSRSARSFPHVSRTSAIRPRLASDCSRVELLHSRELRHVTLSELSSAPLGLMRLGNWFPIYASYARQLGTVDRPPPKRALKCGDDFGDRRSIGRIKVLADNDTADAGAATVGARRCCAVALGFLRHSSVHAHAPTAP